ncbi:MAG: 2'-5' RNA ligase family protein [Azonexaceae bacterium]|nr:2'-5' RNA ligase family protein [Azonexaceae bacterium]
MNLIEGSHTLGNVRRDFPEWHLGRSPYVFWGLDVDFPAIRAQVARAAAHLDGYLLDGYGRQPHVTLDLCGFPCPSVGRADEFSPAMLEHQCTALRAACVSAFEIEVGGLSSFSSAPFLSVVDRGGHIAAVRDCLALGGDARLLGDYVPHVTVGLYGGAWPAHEIGARLASFSAGAGIRCLIERISLLAYQPTEIGGPLTCLANFSLDSGEMRWFRELS